MTSFQGTDTSFYAIDNNHLYLNLNSYDKVPNTDTNYCNFYQYGIRDDNMILGKEYQNDLFNKKYIKAITNHTNECKSSLMLNQPRVQTSSKKVNIYSLLSEMPFLSDTKNIIDKGLYKNILTESNPLTPITFFAFDNDSSQIAYEWLKSHDTKYYIQEFLRINTLPYALPPSSLVGKIIELKTKSEGNNIIANGIGEKLTIKIKSHELRNFDYEPYHIEIDVKAWIQTDNNSWLYILESPILPYIIL
jgi:hypothetical protein